MIGTTMRLMISAAIAMVTALALPNRSPRIAGPMNGTAGADAVSAANTLSLNEKRNPKRNSRNTKAYKPTIAANIATTNAISWTNIAALRADGAYEKREWHGILHHAIEDRSFLRPKIAAPSSYETEQ